MSDVFDNLPTVEEALRAIRRINEVYPSMRNTLEEDMADKTWYEVWDDSSGDAPPTILKTIVEVQKLLNNYKAQYEAGEGEMSDITVYKVVGEDRHYIGGLRFLEPPVVTVPQWVVQVSG